MKTLPITRFIILFLAGLFMLGGAGTVSADTNTAALQKAAGVYTGKFRGSMIRFLSSRSASLTGTLKLPRGRGAGLMKADARSLGRGIVRLPVTFTSAKVNAGGTRVVYKGRFKVPAKLTGGFGGFSGPFSATVRLSGTPKIVAKSQLKAGPVALQASFRGSK